MSKFLRVVVLAVTNFLPSTTVFAQFNLLYQKDGVEASDLLGNSVAGVGDVDGDGKVDFIVGAPLADPDGRTDAGSAYLYSGATGLLLFQEDGLIAGDQLGYSVAGAGDVNGDGRADFLVGANSADPGGRTDAGSAYLYSGATGALLFQKDGFASGDWLGWSVAGIGDVDGDGKSDFIIGAIFADPGGRFAAGSAYLYSGATGTLFFQKDGSDGDDLGVSVAGAGDVDGDGKADFIVGALYADPGGRTDAGSAYLYSGATGALLFQKDGTHAFDWFGRSVAGAGDANGDGRADFIVGAPLADPGGRTDAGSAYLYSGATGALLFQKDGTAADDLLGVSVAVAGDVDGNGRADFIVGAYVADPGGRAEAGSAYLYSGITGLLLFQKDGAGFGDRLGVSVSGVGDVNEDGKDEFILGAYFASPGERSAAGSAYVYAGSACAAAKGDMNADAALTSTDVMLMLNCVFLATGDCSFCFADVNCSGDLTPADVVIELYMVFLAEPAGC